MNTKLFAASSLMLTTAFAIGAFMSSEALAFGGKGFGPDLMDKVQIQATKTDTGAVATITTEDADVLEKIQSFELPERKMGRFEDLEIQKELLDNGAKVTASSSTEEVIDMIHNKVDHLLEKQSITRTVTKLDNGVQITITSTLPEVTEKIQSREAPEKEREGVTHTKENIDGGVRITITTEDPDQVTKIQERAENPHHFHGKRRGHGKHGKGKGMREERGEGREFRGFRGHQEDDDQEGFDTEDDDESDQG